MSSSEGKILDQDGSWELRSVVQYSDGKEGLIKSYIRHVCPVTGDQRYWWHRGTIERSCEFCHEHPAMGIMTAWKLHNFGYLQSNKDREDE